MERRRWAWRLVVASPAVVLIGFVGASLSKADSAQASTPVPCPSPTSLLSPVTSAACEAVQQVTRNASAVASTVHNTVQKMSNAAKNLTGSSSGSAGSGGTSAAGKSTALGSGAHHSHGRTQRSASAGVGALLTGGPLALFPLSPVSQQLNFPKVYPARHIAARAAGPSSRVPVRVWLMFLIGAVCLVGGAGAYFLRWPRLRPRRARTTT
jgi:cobalamin biosynthesis Mg chelatase CobN